MRLAPQPGVGRTASRAGGIRQPLPKVGLFQPVHSHAAAAGRKTFRVCATAAKADQAAAQASTVLPGDGAAAKSGAEQEAEYYEVFLDKPLGVRFGRGTKDGRAYIMRTDPKLGNTSASITPGDLIVRVSASFGSDVWDANNYGQTVYAIRTRSGQVYMKLKRNYGDMSALEVDEMTEAERMFKAERNGGNYGFGTKEMQERNYLAKKEQERQRRAQFDAALAKFKAGKVEEALIEFEEVLALEPAKVLNDDFSRVTQIYRVTQYNIACCYATLGQVEPGLEALEAALEAGFEDFEKVRRDPNLAKLRESQEAFRAVINKYDEPLFNEEAVNAIKGLFRFGKK